MWYRACGSKNRRAAPTLHRGKPAGCLPLPSASTATTKGRAVHLETLLSLRAGLAGLVFIVQRLTLLCRGVRRLPLLGGSWKVLSLSRSIGAQRIHAVARARDLFPAARAVGPIIIPVASGDHMSVDIDDAAVLALDGADVRGIS